MAAHKLSTPQHVQAPRWQKPYQFDPTTTLGNYILTNRSLYTYVVPGHTQHPACQSGTCTSCCCLHVMPCNSDGLSSVTMLMCRETWRLWVYCAVLIAYIIIFNIGFNLLLAFLGRAPL